MRKQVNKATNLIKWIKTCNLIGSFNSSFACLGTEIGTNLFASCRTRINRPEPSKRGRFHCSQQVVSSGTGSHHHVTRNKVKVYNLNEFVFDESADCCVSIFRNVLHIFCGNRVDHVTVTCPCWKEILYSMTWMIWTLCKLKPCCRSKWNEWFQLRPKLKYRAPGLK